ncbi:MAG: response regulator [Anaerolineae bacterium]|nr:response regulator [Anaerolineae bacterium]
MPRVLIADDEPLQRTLIRETLANDPSLSFIEVGDGVQALEEAWANTPDLIILDVMMPEMGGIQVCRILKAEPALQGIPVIMITALESDESRIAGMDAGAIDYIRKPFETVELEVKVQQALRGQTAM